MSFWIITCLLAFLLCVFFAGIVIPQILLIANRKKLYDLPDERKIHHSAVPRLGGIAFKPVVFVTLALLLGTSMASGHTEMLTAFESDSRALVFGFCALMILYLVGMADDLVGVRYRAKFVVQIICGLMLILGGVWIDNLHGLLGIYRISPIFGYPLTVLVTVFVINAINLIDGIDGLASSLSAVACVFYGLGFFFLGEFVYALLSFATLGVLVPFFYYNVFGRPERKQKIFMGDTGSLTVGMLLCFLGINLMLGAEADAVDVPSPALMTVAPLMIPCLDVVRVYFHRVRTGKNPFLPDKNHIHHKLLALGMPQRKAMITIVAVSMALVVSNTVLGNFVNINWIVAADVVFWTSANICLSRKIRKSEQLEKF